MDDKIKEIYDCFVTNITKYDFWCLDMIEAYEYCGVENIRIFTDKNVVMTEDQFDNLEKQPEGEVMYMYIANDIVYEHLEAIFADWFFNIVTDLNSLYNPMNQHIMSRIFVEFWGLNYIIPNTDVQNKIYCRVLTAIPKLLAEIKKAGFNF